MIKVNLSRIMGEQKLNITDLQRLSGVSRPTLAKLYQEKVTSVDLKVLSKICKALNCSVGELLEFIDTN